MLVLPPPPLAAFPDAGVVHRGGPDRLGAGTQFRGSGRQRLSGGGRRFQLPHQAQGLGKASQRSPTPTLFGHFGEIRLRVV